MKTYYVDTNVFLRFYLEKNTILSNNAKKYFHEAKQGKIKLVLLPEIVFEIEYVLRKVYGVSREKTFTHISYLLKQSYIDVKDKNILNQSILIYFSHNVDFVDIYLFLIAKNNNAEVLSFDKDFQKLH